MRPRSALAGLAALGLLAATPEAHAAHATSARISLGALGARDLSLTGGADRQTLTLALPQRLQTVSGTLRLRLTGSPLLRTGSTLSVAVDGRPATAARIHPGAQTLAVPIAAHRVATGDLAVQLTSRLTTRDDRCPPPEAPGAYVDVAPDSAFSLTSVARTGAPALADLPTAVDQRFGRHAPPVSVAFLQAPSSGAVQAAALAVGQISTATGFPGVRTDVALPGTPAVSAPGADQVVLKERPGPTAVSTQRRLDGGITIRLAGPAGRLRDAAAALLPATAATLPGAHADDLARFSPRTTWQRVPRRLAVQGAQADGGGLLTATGGFRVPEWLELSRGARLSVRTAFDAPAGGRALLRVNGVPVDQQTLPSQGRASRDVVAPLAAAGPAQVRGQVRIGDNPVSLDGRLRRAAGVCQPLGVDDGQIGITPGGTVAVKAHARPQRPGLGAWPFPLTARHDATGATLVLPPTPTAGELSAALDTLSEVARWSGEPVATPVAIGPRALPPGNLVVLARAGRVPPALRAAVPVAAGPGALASVRQSGRLVTLAVTPQALRPLRHAMFPTRLSGTVVRVDRSGHARTLVGAAAQSASAVDRSGPPWRWPLAVLIASGALLFARLLWGTLRRSRRADALLGADGAAALPPLEGDDAARLDAWTRRRNG